MRLSFCLLYIFISTPFLTFSQDEVTDPNFTEYQDKVPGTLLFEFGFNALQDNTPDRMNVGFFRSRTANIYYMYDFRLFGSKYLSFNPGFGLGMDNYMFEKDMTITNGGSDQIRVYNANQIVQDQAVLYDTSGNANTSLNKSKISVNYFDIPMEFRFRTRPSKKSFRIAVGGKFGFRIDSKTKVKYEIDGDSYKVKNKSRYGFENFRYGVHGRIGIGSINLFVYYALSELFEKDLVLQNADGTTRKLEGNLSNMTIGLTVVTF